MTCDICERQIELALGVCRECTEAELIIATGSDIDGWELRKINDENVSSKARLRFLVMKGWKYIPTRGLD